jgi:hypothetical protein
MFQHHHQPGMRTRPCAQRTACAVDTGQELGLHCNLSGHRAPAKPGLQQRIARKVLDATSRATVPADAL